MCECFYCSLPISVLFVCYLVESVVDLPAIGLSIAFRLTCLFIPYLISCELRFREVMPFNNKSLQSRAVPAFQSIWSEFDLLACLLPSPTASTYPQNDHFLLFSAVLYITSVAAFSKIPYKYSQCLRTIQKKMHSTARINIEKLKIVLKSVLEFRKVDISLPSQTGTAVLY